jgi:hypothetical protein
LCLGPKLAQPLGLVAHSQMKNRGGASIHGTQAVAVAGADERRCGEGWDLVLMQLHRAGISFWPSRKEESHCARFSMAVSCRVEGTPALAWIEGRGGHWRDRGVAWCQGGLMEVSPGVDPAGDAPSTVMCPPRQLEEGNDGEGANNRLRHPSAGWRAPRVHLRGCGR